MSLRFTIIGDGGMGTVCAVMLAENGGGVRIWSAFADQADELAAHRENRRFLPGCMLPESIEITSDDSHAFDNTDIIISAVPTQYMRSVWSRLKEHCPPGLAICSVAKGIENGTLQRPTEILLDVLGETDRPVAALSGPSIAPEIADKLPATVAVASSSAGLAATIQRCLARPYFRVYTNPDLIGVELAGAMKNVIAIAAGVVDGLGFGNNAKAALLTRGLVEISRLGLAAGAHAETFAGLAGMGDLVTTCFSPVGRNRSFGEAIGSGKTLEQALGETPAVVEGVPTTRSVVELARKLNVEMPITQGIYQVLFENKPAKQAIANLMTRPLRAESESV
ncbi:MAG: NAD(P)-dependent glycerol-3-phosphate dehydrogenase [Phycisphaerae bacterium]|nr:NAD(P)-dependent glycerol-3-phosphate dehydrogenase [Phycisphaerae bacterium]